MKLGKKIIKNILPYLPSNLKDLFQVYNPFTTSDKILLLDIKESGFSNDGFPYIQLSNGKIFYGFKPTRVERFVYKFLIKKNAKRNLKIESFRIALDIVYRYLDKDNNLLSHGKYLNLNKGSIVIECGAYIGYYAIKASEIIGKDGYVVAIEPIEENLNLLSKNIKENSIDNIEIVPKGIWNKKSKQKIIREKRQRASINNLASVKTNQEIEIDCDSLDNILKNHDITKDDFIRIQVNGAEIEALKGMEKTLKKGPKILITSLYDKNKTSNVKIIKMILANNDYRVEFENGVDILASKIY